MDGDSKQPRVVVTGMGLVTPLGIGVEASWQGAVEGHSCARRITRFDPSPFHVQIACEIDDNLFIYEISNGGRLQITTEGGILPAWSPDGEKLAFSWYRDGSYDIYVVDLDDVTGTD